MVARVRDRRQRDPGLCGHPGHTRIELSLEPDGSDGVAIVDREGHVSHDGDVLGVEMDRLVPLRHRGLLDRGTGAERDATGHEERQAHQEGEGPCACRRTGRIVASPAHACSRRGGRHRSCPLAPSWTSDASLRLGVPWSANASIGSGVFVPLARRAWRRIDLPDALRRVGPGRAPGRTLRAQRDAAVGVPRPA